MTLAPIALFVYNRPKHTKMTVDALMNNPEVSRSNLFIFSDAAKKEEDENNVNIVREYLETIDGFAKVHIIKREVNWGLANSIIDGVTHILNEFESVIVLEDDLETSSYFLKFMNETLVLYKNYPQVGAVTGYMHPVEPAASNIVFWTVPHSWGWATWRDRWKNFNQDGEKLARDIESRRLTGVFNNAGPQPLMKMLQDQVKGKNNSWAVRWSASLFLKDMLTIMPQQSLVRNFGIDGTGTHCAHWRINPYEVKLKTEPVKVEQVEPYVPQEVLIQFRSYFRKVRLIRYINFLYRVLRIGKYKLRMVQQGM